jgi:hypothetical protein
MGWLRRASGFLALLTVTDVVAASQPPRVISLEVAVASAEEGRSETLRITEGRCGVVADPDSSYVARIEVCVEDADRYESALRPAWLSGASPEVVLHVAWISRTIAGEEPSRATVVVSLGSTFVVGRSGGPMVSVKLASL